MSDARLRALLRRWRETQDEADGVAYLRARLEVGGLEAERVELAAFLGHEVALSALGAREAFPRPSDLRDWVFQLERYGLEACVRAAVACLRMILPAEEPEESPRREGIRAAERLLTCPCDKHEKEARIAWTEDASWANEVPWAELAAEVAWSARWRSSEQAVREAIAEVLVPWALEETPKSWDAPGTWNDP